MTIRMDIDLHDRILAMAEREKRTRSAQIEVLLESALATLAQP